MKRLIVITAAIIGGVTGIWGLVETILYAGHQVRMPDVRADSFVLWGWFWLILLAFWGVVVLGFTTLVNACLLLGSRSWMWKHPPHANTWKVAIKNIFPLC